MPDLDPFAPPRAARTARANAEEPSLPEGETLRRGPWRNGNDVVAQHRVVWPRRCLSCNAPVGPDESPVRMTLSWVPPGILITGLFGLWSYVLARASVRQRGTLGVFFCPRHRRQRQLRRILQPMLVVLLGLAGLGLDEAFDEPLWGLAAAIVVFIGLFAPTEPLRPQRIRNPRIDLRGVGPAFLASLPPLDETIAGRLADLAEVTLDPDLVD